MLIFALTGAPASEPVSAAQLRAHARLDDNGDSTELDGFLLDARHLIESYTGRTLVAQTWTASLEAWPEAGADGRVRFRLAPHPASISSVVVDGVALAASLYALIGDEIVFAPELDMTPDALDPTSLIVVTFTTSPGLTQAPPLGRAIKILAAHLYEYREPVTMDQLAGVPGLAMIITQYRKMRELN